MTERGIGDNQPSAEVTAQLAIKRLAGDYAGIEQSAKAILDDARKLPTTVNDEAALEAVGVGIVKLRNHTNHVEELRKVEKEPYLRGGKAVDEWFGAIKDRLGKAMKILSLRVNDYQQEKLAKARAALDAEAERARQEAIRVQEEANKAKAEERSKQEVAQSSLDAKIAQQQAAMAAMQAAASDAEIGKQRLAGGGSVSFRSAPVIEITDWNKLPLDVLRPFIKQGELLAAVKAWARSTDYEATMPGVHIERQSKAVVR